MLNFRVYAFQHLLSCQGGELSQIILAWQRCDSHQLSLYNGYPGSQLPGTYEKLGAPGENQALLFDKLLRWINKMDFSPLRGKP